MPEEKFGPSPEAMDNKNKDMPAQRRRKKAEDADTLSLSHWRGELHSHTKTSLSNPENPEDAVEHRRGSNCGKIPLEILTRYHAEAMRDDFIAITDHSRDADPQTGITGTTEWFTEMYLNNEAWLQKKFRKSRDKISSKEMVEIKKIAEDKAKELILYGDERLEEVLSDIDSLSPAEKPFSVLKGVEVNILPDGSFDTGMVKEGQFDIVNVSVHPNLDRKAYEPIVNDPEQYSELILKGIKNKKTNIITHIGEGVSSDVVAQLRWEDFAKEARENQVAIEINLRKLMSFIQEDIFDYDKYPANDKKYLDDLREKMDELVPVISSSKIRGILAPHIKRGLKFAINTDEHQNRFIKTSTDKNGTTAHFKQRGIRFWRCMKVVEEYFNTVFKEMGVDQDDIINTYSKDKLTGFLKK